MTDARRRNGARPRHPDARGGARRSRPLLAAALALALPALLASCGDGPEVDGTSGAAEPGSAADLLSALGGGGTAAGAGPEGSASAGSARPPGAPRAQPQGGAPVRRAWDVAELGFDRGSPDAPVRVVEFSDFGCGYCRQFHVDTWPGLEDEYVRTGKVQWKYVPFILGIFDNAEEAAAAGECAGEQGHFDAFGERLFHEQPEWKPAGDPGEVFERIAREEGLDLGRFQRCIAEGWRAERIQAGTALGRQLGVRGTPTFMILGFGPIPGAIPGELFRQVLDTVYVQTLRGGAPAGGR